MDAGKAIRLAMMVAKSIGMPAKASGGEVRAMPTVNLGGRNIPITANTTDIRDGYKLVPLHTSKIEDSFQKSDMYVGPFGARGIGKRYEQFADFQKDADAIEAPSLSVNSSGHVNFGNGRHRYSYMRDNGVPAIHVSMHPDSIRNARKHGMVAGPVVDKPISTFDYDRRERGIHKASGGAVDGDSIPDAPGTTPVKDGYVRLYHQTSEENLGQIEKNGLLLKHARGIEGPRAIYAGETPFYRKADSHPTLEFQVPKNHWQSPFVLKDVVPEDFIAAHYPWHRDARYLEENNLVENALNGKYDKLSGDTAKAVDYIKRKYATKKASGGEVSGYETGGMPGDDGDSLLPQGRAQQRMAGNLAAGPQPTNIAKEPGGQWLSGSVESAVKPLKVDRMGSLRGMQSPADALAVSKERLSAMDARQASGGTSPLNDRDFQALRAGHERVVKDASRHVAINDWVGSTLKKYIQRDMATEHDPVRALAEKGILHLSEDELLSNQLLQSAHHNKENTKLANSDLAKGWENLSDNVIEKETAAELTKQGKHFGPNNESPTVKANPWLNKVDPLTPVHSIEDRTVHFGNLSQDLGFNHLIDELGNSMAENSGLPQHLVLRPESLKRMSMPQAVEHVSKINEWRAENKRKIAAEKANTMTQHKQYPDGMRWVRLDQPGQFAEESDAMGHSVRGYEPPEKGGTYGYGQGGWDAIQSGKAKVYSLRDKNNQPHVTVETGRGPLGYRDLVRHLGGDEDLANDYLEKGFQAQAGGNSELTSLGHALKMANVPRSEYISQIKGKSNERPSAKYIPYVQDFVKSGDWSDVSDLHNTDLIKVDKDSDMHAKIRAAGETPPRYVTQDELTSFIHKNMIHKAGGGEVDGDSLLPQGPAQQRMAGNLAAGPQPTNIIKAPGGQWLSGSVEQALNPLRKNIVTTRGVEDPAEAIPHLQSVLDRFGGDMSGPAALTAERLTNDLKTAHTHKAVNDWVGTTLTKYVKNEMATEKDPVRKMLDAWPEQRDAKLKPIKEKMDRLQAKLDDPNTEDRFKPSAMRELGELDDQHARISSHNPLHVDPEQINFKTEYHGKGMRHGQSAVAQSDPAKAWEGASDALIDGSKASEYQGLPSIEELHETLSQSRKENSPEIHRPKLLNHIQPNLQKAALVKENPWLNKVDPNTPFHWIYDYTDAFRDLGFDHLRDELHNAIRHDTDLPQNLRLRPESLQRMSVPQAIDHVSKINQWREDNLAAANKDKAFNPAVKLMKQYPGSDLAWYEISKPDPDFETKLPEGYKVFPGLHGIWTLEHPGGRLQSLGDFKDVPLKEQHKHAHAAALDQTVNKNYLKEALQYEGSTMGHCVGGYSDSVFSGDSRIFSLRNKRTGAPHVTVEAAPAQMRGGQSAEEWLSSPLDIKQIKGKGNKKPADKYIPHVQDFVKSGNWGHVEDFQNTDLVDWENLSGKHHLHFLNNSPRYNEATQKMAMQGQMPSRYMTEHEFHNPETWLKSDASKQGDAPRKARGGTISNVPVNVDPQKAIRKAMMIAKAVRM